MLLALDTPFLQQYLSQTVLQHGAQLSLDQPRLGQLTAQQVANLKLLSRLHVQQRRYREAAVILIKLAERYGDVGDVDAGARGAREGVEIGERVELLTSAAVHAGAMGQGAFSERVDMLLKVAEVQQELVGELKGMEAAGVGRLAADIEALTWKEFSLTDLYGNFA